MEDFENNVKNGLKTMKKNISKLAKFKRIDPNVLEKYGVTDALLETGCHESIELGLFGEPAKIFFSQQNADFENVEINGEGGIYIVDGSLSVKGSLTFAAFDAYTFLVITGNLNVSADFIQKEDEKENHKATRCEKKPKIFGKTKKTLKNEKIKFIKFKLEKGDISLSSYLFEISLFTADLKTF